MVSLLYLHLVDFDGTVNVGKYTVPVPWIRHGLVDPVVNKENKNNVEARGLGIVLHILASTR